MKLSDKFFAFLVMSSITFNYFLMRKWLFLRKFQTGFFFSNCDSINIIIRKEASNDK